jgi:hypothetical protein
MVRVRMKKQDSYIIDIYIYNREFHQIQPESNGCQGRRTFFFACTTHTYQEHASQYCQKGSFYQHIAGLPSRLTTL